MSYLRYFVCLHIVVSNTYCVVFVFFVLVLCILCCQFLCVVLSVFSKFYFPTDQY